MTAIRIATADDVPELLRLNRAELTEEVSLGGHPVSDHPKDWVSSAMAWLAAIEEPQALVLVAIAGGRVVGYDLAIWRDLEPPFLPKRILRVVSVYLEPAHRGGALAAEIVRASLDWGRREGCVEADCQTLADNRARHLLSRGGFRVALLEMRMGL